MDGCRYCDREFEDELVLQNHQKAKHFKCNHCNRRLNTIGGLVTHAEHMHKEIVRSVPNAIPGRETTEYEIYGMIGIPEEHLEARERGEPIVVKKVRLDPGADRGTPPPVAAVPPPAPGGLPFGMPPFGIRPPFGFPGAFPPGVPPGMPPVPGVRPVMPGMPPGMPPMMPGMPPGVPPMMPGMPPQPGAFPGVPPMVRPGMPPAVPPPGVPSPVGVPPGMPPAGVPPLAVPTLAVPSIAFPGSASPTTPSNLSIPNISVPGVAMPVAISSVPPAAPAANTGFLAPPMAFPQTAAAHMPPSSTVSGFLFVPKAEAAAEAAAAKSESTTPSVGPGETLVYPHNDVSVEERRASLRAYAKKTAA